jgi:hypothetical protein
MPRGNLTQLLWRQEVLRVRVVVVLLGARHDLSAIIDAAAKG